MGRKDVNYSVSSIPEMKRSVIASCVSAILMLGMMILEIYLYLYSRKIGLKLGSLDKIVLISTVVFAGMFLLWQFLKIVRKIMLISKIKKENNVIKKQVVFNFSNKKSFGHFIRLLTYILSTLTSILAFGFGTYFVLKFIYAESLNFYVPLLFAILITNIYSCISIDEEMNLNVSYY